MSKRLLAPPVPGPTQPQSSSADASPGASADASPVTSPEAAPGEAPGAAPAAESGRPGPSPARRLLLRALTALVSLGGTAAALSPLLRAREDGGGVRSGAGGGGQAPYEDMFDEMYRGRHIRGGILPDEDRAGAGQAGGTRAGAQPAAGVRAGGAQARWARGQVVVFVDGRSLHVMRRADGSYMSALHHFESFATPREAARAAVDSLGASAQLA